MAKTVNGSFGFRANLCVKTHTTLTLITHTIQWNLVIIMNSRGPSEKVHIKRNWNFALSVAYNYNASSSLFNLVRIQAYLYYFEILISISIKMQSLH